TTNTAVNFAAGGTGNADKTWVNASIQITPATATNAVGTNHTLTITVNGINGNIDGGSHTATASIVSGPGTFVVGPTCTYAGGGATATCLVVIRATTTGGTVEQEAAGIAESGQTIQKATDGTGSNSNDPNK